MDETLTDLVREKLDILVECEKHLRKGEADVARLGMDCLASKLASDALRYAMRYLGYETHAGSKEPL